MSASTLIADLAKKSGLVWICFDGRSHAVWHEWVEDSICLVTSGTEQSIPGLTDQKLVTVLLRSKSTRALAAQTTATVEIVRPDSELWESVATTLKTGRLNLHDSSHAVERWARESVIVRLIPADSATVPGQLPTEIAHTAPHLNA